MKTTAFNGAVTFNTRFRTNGTDRVMRRLYQANEARLTTDDEKSEFALVCMILSCTTRVEFDLPDSAGDELGSLKDFCDWYFSSVVNEFGSIICDETELATLLQAHDGLIGTQVDQAWYNAYKAAQSLFTASPEIAHPSTLTPVQLADDELKKKDETPAPA